MLTIGLAFLVVTGGNEDSTREALQSALLRVVRNIREFPNDAVFWGWLTVLARSALFDQTRKRRRYFAFLALGERRGPSVEARALYDEIDSA